MTKWFDTNYHYLVPGIYGGSGFPLASTKAVREYREAKAQRIETRPVLLGPVSYLLLGKRGVLTFSTAIPVAASAAGLYRNAESCSPEAGAYWVQLDEPCLVLDLSDTARAAFGDAYASADERLASPKIMFGDLFGSLADNLPTALAFLCTACMWTWCARLSSLMLYIAGARAELVLSLGVIDGRNFGRPTSMLSSTV